MPTLQQIAQWLTASVITGNGGMSRQVAIAHSCDLMSDLLAFSCPDAVLLTGLVNEQVVRTAEVAGMAGVIIVRGKRPSAKVVETARDLGMPVMATELSLFDAGGILFSRGMRGFSLHSRQKCD